MNGLHAIILGIVEGITEFLPISSTAHLEITTKLIGLTSTEFVKTFEIVIQLGAILAIVVLYARVLSTSKALWQRIIVAFLPTAIVGFVLYKIIKNILLGNTAVAVWALFIGGIIMIVFEIFYKERSDTQTSIEELEVLPYWKAFVIGLAQSLAVVPGVSRAAATIVSGQLLGVRRRAIVEFSFLLAIPTMLAASGYDVLKTSASLSGQQVGLLCIGFITAFITALISVKFLLRLITKNTFITFGIYRIAIAILLFLFVL